MSIFNRLNQVIFIISCQQNIDIAWLQTNVPWHHLCVPEYKNQTLEIYQQKCNCKIVALRRALRSTQFIFIWGFNLLPISLKFNDWTQQEKREKVFHSDLSYLHQLLIFSWRESFKFPFFNLNYLKKILIK